MLLRVAGTIAVVVLVLMGLNAAIPGSMQGLAEFLGAFLQGLGGALSES